MKNKEISNIFYEIADFLEMKDVDYKPRAYRKAARNIEALTENIENLCDEGKLEEIGGVGSSIAEKIIEYLETGKLEYYENLKNEIPVEIEDLTKIEGIGPKSVKRLNNELGIKDLEGLENAAKKGKIAEVKGFGEKTQKNILENIESAKESKKRKLLGKIFPLVQNLEKRLKDDDAFHRVTIVGSYRRRKPTVGDIDILSIADNSREAMNHFCNLEDAERTLVKGDTKSSIVLSGGFQVDLRIVDESSYGSALMYFTGSKDHNVSLRNKAKKKNRKLNEYGLFNSEDEKLASETENEVYKKLNMSYIPPELRENTGEIEAAERRKLPDLVEEREIKGDLQVHTNYTDGSASVKEMAEKAQEKELEYILISDHGPSLKIAGGIPKEEFQKQREEIEKVNDELKIQILQGIEANIGSEGLDISEEWCEECDFLCVGLHDRPNNPTERILSVFDEYPVDILVHPFGRKFFSRNPLDLNIDKIVAKAKEEHIALEINAQPERLDLDWQNVKKYRNQAKYVVSTDAHSKQEMDFIYLGVSQARRGWCEKENILNTQPIDKLRSYLNG